MLGQTLPAWITAITAFTSVFISEVAWILCVRWTARGEKYKTASMACFLVLIGWAGLIVLLGNPWVAIPSEMIGAFTGTMVAFWVDKKI